MLMYTIELTQGVAWDAPVMEVHSVQSTIHIIDVDRMARELLRSTRQTAQRLGPTNYRILDPLGRCVRSSAAAAVQPKTFTSRAGRTYWV
jgi:hypothetical protein